MKIVKWVTGLDHSKKPVKLQYPAFEEKLAGHPIEEIERVWAEGENVVKDCIRRNGFRFSGEYHQYGAYGMPMFDDGSVMYCSWRHWGAIMAEAWNGVDGKWYNYLDFYMTAGGKDPVVPKNEQDFL